MSISSHIKINTKEYLIDQHGFLSEFETWDHQWLHYHTQPDLSLSELHHSVIQLTRSFYQSYQIGLKMRPYMKFLTQENSTITGTEQLYELFGDNPLKTISLLAGLPPPPHCL